MGVGEQKEKSKQWQWSEEENKLSFLIIIATSWLRRGIYTRFSEPTLEKSVKWAGSELSDGNLSISCCLDRLVLFSSEDLFECVKSSWKQCFSYAQTCSLSTDVPISQLFLVLFPSLQPKQACLLWTTFWLTFLCSLQLIQTKGII